LWFRLLARLQEMNDEQTLMGICDGEYFWTSDRCGVNETDQSGVWVSPAVLRPSAKTKGCIRPTEETANIACCADFKDPDKLEKEVAARLAFDNETWGPLKVGYTGWCAGGGSHHCKRYEGDCSPFPRVPHFTDCEGVDFCCKGCGPKYGFERGVSVCVPRYHTNQISFTPTRMMKSRPADMILSPRGDIEFPKNNATVRIVQGYNWGCLGVHDGSARVALDSGPLQVQGGWEMRPAGFPLSQDQGCGGGLCSPNLPHNTEPWIEWKQVTLEAGFLVPEHNFEEGMHHVCMCDGSLNCNMAENWHDLGELFLERNSERFPQVCR
jgi:hypothetical protein